MTTPPPDIKVQSETLEEIASRILEPIIAQVGPLMYRELVWQTVSALRRERERCARVAYEYLRRAYYSKLATGCAAAVRKGDMQ